MQNSKQVLSKKTQELIDKLLLCKFSVPEVAKVTGISEEVIKTYTKS